MTWKFVGSEKGLEPLPGIPLEASDSDFEAAVAVYEAQFPDFVTAEGVAISAKGSVKASGLYAKVKGVTSSARDS